MTNHTVSGSVFLPDGTDVWIGQWTVAIYGSGYTLDDAGNWRGGEQTWDVLADGSLSITLPETDGTDFYYTAKFRSLDKRTTLGPYPFDLMADKTWTDIIETPSVPPITPSLIAQAEAAATQAQGYAQQAAGSVSLVAWAPTTTYASGDVRQAPDGTTIVRISDGTSSTVFDAGEATYWNVQIIDPATLAGTGLYGAVDAAAADAAASAVAGEPPVIQAAAERALNTAGVVTGATDISDSAPIADRVWGLATSEGHALPVGFNAEGIYDSWSRARTLLDLHEIVETRDDPEYARLILTEDGHILYAERWDGTILAPGLASSGSTVTQTREVIAETKAFGIVRAGMTAATTTPVAVVNAGMSIAQGLWASDQEHTYFAKVVYGLRNRYAPGVSPSAIEQSTTADFTAYTGAGVHGYNAGLAGSNAGSYLTDAECDKIAALNPLMILHYIGTNDYGFNVSPDTYHLNLANRLAYLDSVITGPYVNLLLHGNQRWDMTGTWPWSDYRAAMYDVYSADKDSRIFVDMGPAFVVADADGGGTHTDPFNLINDTDQVHYTNAGHAFAGDLILTGLGI